MSKNRFKPNVCEVGYLGIGEHTTTVDGKNTQTYTRWKHMLSRCYDPKDKRYHRYGGRGIAVCKEWHNFQTFATWVVSQPNYDKEGFQLDKDLRIKDSKEYSPKTCSFVPTNINNLLIYTNSKRGDYPVGVSVSGKKYRVQCKNNDGKYLSLGYYSTPEQAFQAYKEYKESLIKQIVKEEYEKGNIIKEVYDNLMIYEVVPFPE